jgi:hypothetical protein
VTLDNTENLLQKLRPPRRDPLALSFGATFVVLGIAGLFRIGGMHIDADALSQLALVALGSAGLFALLASRGRRA